VRWKWEVDIVVGIVRGKMKWEMEVRSKNGMGLRRKLNGCAKRVS
jgi:hypothetical protein